MPRWSVLFVALLISAPAAAVDDWVPYDDGRIGGCYRTASGVLYSCSRAPRTVDETPATTEGDPIDAAVELRAVRRELEALKQRQADEDARREREESERTRGERSAKDAEQRDHAAAMAAYNAIEAAKDSERLRSLDAKTQACRITLEKRGYRIVGPGACQAPDASYVNCPDC